MAEIPFPLVPVMTMTQLTACTSTCPCSQITAQSWTLTYRSLNAASSRAPTGHSADRRVTCSSLFTQGDPTHVPAGKGTELQMPLIQ